jgi:hypothetical protein
LERPLLLEQTGRLQKQLSNEAAAHQTELSWRSGRLRQHAEAARQAAKAARQWEARLDREIAKREQLEAEQVKWQQEAQRLARHIDDMRRVRVRVWRSSNTTSFEIFSVARMAAARSIRLL